MPSTAEDWDAAIADFGQQGTHHMQNMSWGQLKKLRGCKRMSSHDIPMSVSTSWLYWIVFRLLEVRMTPPPTLECDFL
eukprot:6024815-Amphidinium_carterae.1